MADLLAGKYVVFSESGRHERQGQIVGLVGANHCLIRFDAEKPALRLMNLQRLEATTCNIFDTPQDGGVPHQDVDDEVRETLPED
jgi:hypothetical protein